MKLIGLSILVFLLIAYTVSARVGGGVVTYEVKSAGNVMFSHESHITQIGLKCTACHDSLYITKGKDRPVTMAQMEKGLSCGACHNGKKAFDVKIKENCNNCHKK